MPIGTISNGDTGLSARTKINAALAAIDATVKVTSSTSAPSATDDSSEGYAVNSKWFNNLTGIEYICRDATDGAAIWVRQDNADFFGYVSTRFYHGILGTQAGGAAIGGNAVKLHPIVIKERVIISELAARVITAEATKNFQLGIYAAHPTTRFPTGNPLATTASMSCGVTGAMSGDITDITLDPGLYWVAMNTDSTTAVWSTYGSGGNNIPLILGTTSASQSASGNASSTSVLSFNHTFGTWPDLTAASYSYGNNSAYAMVFFRVA
jgi:hypothetical protein